MRSGIAPAIRSGNIPASGSTESDQVYARMEGPPSRIVGKRRVIHVGGFDPVEPERLNHRLVGGLARLASLWNITAAASPPDLSPDSRVISWQVEAQGPNWRTETTFSILRWDDLIVPYMGAVWWRKILDGYAALAHFVLNGTIWRYFSANARYGLFVIYPLFLLIAFAALSILVAAALARLDLPFSALLGVIAGVATLVVLLRWAGSYFHLYFALADWSFAADLARGRVSGFDECIEQFAGEIRKGARAEADEVIFSGVSLGAVVMAEALAKALEEAPELCRRGPPVAFLAIGSSILKIGLHPSAKRLKSAVARLSAEAALFWVEYQSKVDPINFFRTDPVKRMGLPATGKPIVRTVHIRKMMTSEEYRRLRTNFLRLHRQFAMPNSVRYFYDFYLICFGPMPLRERVALGERAVAALDADGSFSEIAANPKRQAALAGVR